MVNSPTIYSRLALYALWSILFSGIALRIVVFLQNRSLFLDEANLALNYATKSFFGLFSQLDNRQYAPPLFSVVEKANTLLFGMNEYALRLFPLLSGITLLWLFYRFCEKHIDRQFLWFPLALLAFSPYFIRYATEVKQYSTDALITIALLLLVFRFPVGHFDRRAAIIWAVVGSFSIWFSMPSVFVLAGVGAYYLYSGFRQKKKQMNWLLLPFACWLFSFAIYFFLILQQDAATDNLREHHAVFFFPLIPSSSEDLALIGQILLSFFRSSIGKTTLAIAWGIVTVLISICYWFKKDKAFLLLLSVPVITCIFASGLQYYSLMPRLTLFFLPILLFFIGHGTAFLFQKAAPYIKPVILIALLAILADWQVLKHFYKPYQLEEIKPVMVYITANLQRNALVYVNYNAAPAFLFYTKHHSNKGQYRFPNTHIGSWGQYSDKVPNRKGRMWLIFSHETPEGVETDLGTIRKKGKIVDRFQNMGAQCYLIE